MTRYAELALVRSMRFLADAQATISHNLANVDTAGFKRRAPLALESSAFQTVLGERMPLVRFSEVTDWQLGNTRQTANRFDVALGADSWFRVQDPKGRVYLTRNGQMNLDSQGRLVTREGLPYLDQGGNPIILNDGEGSPNDVAISPNGTVTDPKTGQTWGPIGIFRVADPRALQPVGAGMYAIPEGTRLELAPDGAQQGFQESSNVDSLQELVQMIIVQRSFSATQRALGSIGRMQDELIQNMNR